MPLNESYRVRPTAFLLAALALSACTAPAPVPPPANFTLVPEAAERVRNTAPAKLQPQLSPRQLVSNFQRYCGRFIGDPDGTIARLRADGYFLIARDTRNNAEIHATSNSRPPISVERGPADRPAKGCYISTRGGGDYRASVDRYIRDKHGEAVARADDVVVRGRPNLESLWIASATPFIQYVSSKQTDPILGEVYAFGVLTP